MENILVKAHFQFDKQIHCSLKGLARLKREFQNYLANFRNFYLEYNHFLFECQFIRVYRSFILISRLKEELGDAREGRHLWNKLIYSEDGVKEINCYYNFPPNFDAVKIILLLKGNSMKLIMVKLLFCTCKLILFLLQ